MTDSTKKNIPYLDGWRGVAIILVLQSHFLFGGGGRLGVHLFFVLSGYLMSDLLFIKKVALTTFFARRINRIIPTFWLYTVLAAAYAGTLQPAIYHVSFTDLLATLTFVRTYLPVDLSIWSDKWPIGHFWSLNVEEHSYVFLAIVALVGRKLPDRVVTVAFLGLATLLVLLMNTYYFAHPPGGASPWFVRSECASLGLIAAASLRVFRAGTSVAILKNPNGMVPIVALILGIAFLGPFSAHAFNLTLAPLCLAVAINYVDRAPAILHRMLSMPVLRWAGIASFSLYVWQQPFFLASTQFGLQPQVAGLLAILLGAAVFKWIENPARVFLNRAWGRYQQSQTAKATVAETRI